MAKIAKQRSNIYGFLATVYLQEPTIEFIRSFRESTVLSVLNELGLKLSKRFHNISEEKLVEELLLEYNRLFIGPGKHISPYESVYKENEGTLWGKTTIEVKRFIESLGLKYCADWTGLPDHIGVELEFMQKLTSKEKSAWEQKDNNIALRCLEFEKKFIDEHLIQWIFIFCDKVVRESNNSFYRQIAKLTKKFVDYDKKQLSELVK